MDFWLKVIKFKIYNKWHFTFFIFATTALLLGLFFLINVYILGVSFQGPHDFFKEILLSGKKNRVWSPESLLVVILILIIFWITTVIFPLLVDIWHTWQSPCSWRSNKDLHEDCYDDFIYDGNITRDSEKNIRITNSDAGVLLKNMYWKNFLIEFNFNFEDLRPVLEKDFLRNIDNTYKDIIHKPKSNYIGFLFRAQDLDNYFMISIGLKEILKDKNRDGEQKYDLEKKLIITPHVKVDGKWKIFTHKVANSSYINEKEFNFVSCRVKDLKVTLNLYKNKKNKNNSFNFEWDLPPEFFPTYTDLNQVKEKKEEYSYGDSSKIIFLNMFGMVGFRAYGDEQFIVKDIVVTKLC